MPNLTIKTESVVLNVLVVLIKRMVADLRVVFAQKRTLKF